MNQNGASGPDIGAWAGEQAKYQVDPSMGNAFQRPSQFADWSGVMRMLANPSQAVIHQIMLIADFSNEGGKHGEHRRRAMLSNLKCGTKELVAPATNRLGILEATAAEIERIEHFLEHEALPEQSRDADDKDGGIDYSPYVRVLYAAARVSGWNKTAAEERLNVLRAQGQALHEKIERSQAMGIWVDYTEVRRKMHKGVREDEMEDVFEELPQFIQRSLGDAWASTAGRLWGHYEALNGNTMDYSRNPKMLQYLPNPMGTGPRRSGGRRQRHEDDDQW